MNNLIKLILLIFIISVNAEEGSKKRYCTKAQVRDVMKLACFNSYAQKRSFINLASSDLWRDKQYNLWKKVFNINDNSTISIPMVILQKRLLFQPCNDYQKKLTIKNLIDLMDSNGDYKNQELTNDHFNNYQNYGSTNDNNYELPINQFKRESGIVNYEFVEQCCVNSCTFKELKSYCPDRE